MTPETERYIKLLEERLNDIEDALFLVVRQYGKGPGHVLDIDAARLPTVPYGVNIDRVGHTLFLVAFTKEPTGERDKDKS